MAPGLWRRYLMLLLDGLRYGATALPVAAPDLDTLAEIGQRWTPPRRPATG
ncbi:hypothetical protein [Dactylosporangium sp. CA-233914]|uniref:hypothetical protein n=1 Tax=Dactylosporangium sp. CA-233914 TaxID=3239934 RepID=UPI003D8C8262